MRTNLGRPWNSNAIPSDGWTWDGCQSYRRSPMKVTPAGIFCLSPTSPLVNCPFWAFLINVAVACLRLTPLLSDVAAACRRSALTSSHYADVLCCFLIDCCRDKPTRASIACARLLLLTKGGESAGRWPNSLPFICSQEELQWAAESFTSTLLFLFNLWPWDFKY